MHRLIRLALAGILLLPFFHHALAQSAKGRRVAKGGRVAPAKQPIAFSHRTHAEGDLQCLRCHAGAETGEQAGIPTASDCADCHSRMQSGGALLQTLSEYERSGKAIPWVRIYDLPDFVFFSHRSHLRVRTDCRDCHGPVERRDALWQEKEISMKACIACHKERGASTACNYCHELNQ